MAEYVNRIELRDALYEADAITMKGVSIINQFQSAPITNADRIRSMTDEELAEFLESENGKPWFRCNECKFESCAECALEWLKKEVDDG